jgi:gamma-glutamyltranspeptidase/glutathione hydrolase
VEAEASSLEGVVASEVSLASSIGARILAEGGNAVDAAVAVSLALAVTIPHLGGVGGDFFMLYRTPEGRVYFVNGSGVAPRRLTREEVLGRGFESIPERGPLSAVVPGMLAGLYEAWRRFGSAEWSRLVRPARALAARGFPMPETTARALAALEECLSRDPGSREGLLRQLPRAAGAPARMPGLAALLEGYEEDPWYPYRGEPAEALEEYMFSVGGVMGYDDLKSFRPDAGEPLVGEYRGVRVYEMPPNSQGAATLYILYGLERREPPQAPFSRERAEALAEEARIAYRIRDAYIGDPRRLPVPPERLQSREFYEEERARATGAGGAAGGLGDTTFFAVADSEGGVVAGIQSLFYPFGSCVTEPRFQVTLNNRALGFTLREGLPYTLAPGARPLHTLSAVILELGEGRVAALGASGGHLRPQQHALFITNIVDYGMGVGEAINAPRAVLNPETGSMMYEEGWEPGEGWRRVERIGVANAVEVRGMVKIGYTDRRGEGLPAPA